MYKICVFAGTTEGRELIDFLTEQDASVYACVATEYGGTLIEQREGLTVSAKRLTGEEMGALFLAERFDCVVDATHPYAPVVTENISGACQRTGTPYLRLLREEGTLPGNAIYVRDTREAVAYLSRTEGRILLTTGSKELCAYGEIPDFAQRVYARVLPMEDSLAACTACGLAPSHIIAMQGPFTREMNEAMLAMVKADILVTKEAGSRGGFQEKAEAAAAQGVILLVIGRPPQRSGRSYREVKAELQSRFGFQERRTVTIVGIGPGSRNGMTVQAQRAVDQAECVIGAKRMVASVVLDTQACREAITPEEIAAIIREDQEHRRFAVVMSGDVGFFSGAKKLLPLLDDLSVQVVPGISSLVYLCAKLGTSYEDVVPVSLHGRDRDIIPVVERNRRTFALVGGENGMGALCEALVAGGFGDARVSAGERLGYDDEKITVGTASELAGLRFHSLSVALIEHDRPIPVTHGMPDEAFLRGCHGDGAPVPMTKSEVRAVALSKLELTQDAVCYDIGAGTGSVAIEMARQATDGKVFAVEYKEDALALLRENKERFHADNLEIVAGAAPDACRELPPPTHVFLGGSGGKSREILELLLKKNPKVRIVATAIALESIAELSACQKILPFQWSQAVSLTVARDRKAGPYHLMTGQNPIYLFTFQG